MSDRAEQLFQQLQNAAAILSLIGQSESVHFDGKEWPARDEDAQKVFTKAACGLTNAEGRVLVVGMKAKASTPLWIPTTCFHLTLPGGSILVDMWIDSAGIRAYHPVPQ